MTTPRENEIYQADLRRINDLMSAQPGTPEIAELDFLATVVESYEERMWPQVTTSPRDDACRAARRAITGGKP